MERFNRADRLAREAHFLSCQESRSLWGALMATLSGPGTPEHVRELIDSANSDAELLSSAAARVADLYGDSAGIRAREMLRRAELEALRRIARERATADNK